MPGLHLEKESLKALLPLSRERAKEKHQDLSTIWLRQAGIGCMDTGKFSHRAGKVCLNHTRSCKKEKAPRGALFDRRFRKKRRAGPAPD
ncbi:hypothetical protein [Paraburkholderia sp. GAS334]|jgi:hypothetical protein|uniref:hypothetical protein n=1 Tax=unclassified Paraburkholderia TaxID=2615204 RepID=UPI003D1E1C6D